MKKFFIFALALTVAVCIVACTKGEDAKTNNSTVTTAEKPSSQAEGSDALLTTSQVKMSDTLPTTSNEANVPKGDEYIAPNMALKIATTHAGVYDVIDTEVELDYENGKAIYEVSFEKDNVEYEYEIDAITGDVLRFESEIDD